MELIKTNLEILQSIPVEQGTKIELKPDCNYQFMQLKDGPHLIVIKANRIVKEISNDVLEKQKQEEHEKELKTTISDEEYRERAEYTRKWQIKTGHWHLHSDKGLLPAQKEDEVYFETNTSKKLLSILGKFQKNYHKMAKYKKNKRSYLLYSEPGVGKSALIRHFCRNASLKEGVSVIKVGGDVDFSILHHMFLSEYSNDVKQIVLVIEDFGKKDWTNNQNIYNPSCLNFLDGNIDLFKVPTLIITTTNFAKELGQQLTCRPGRFNQIIKVAPPSNEEVYQLMEYCVGRALSSEEKDLLKDKNLNPDYCLEVAIRSDIDDISLKEAISVVLKERTVTLSWNKSEGNN